MPKKTVVVACSTIRPELQAVMERYGCDYPVFYMDARLHDRPDDLRKTVQQTLDTLTDVDRVLLPFGYCGGTTVGLRSGDFEMFLPKSDDCITLFLGSRENREAVPDERYTFFLTQGWLDSERNILQEYQRLCSKYNQRRADRVMKAMYQNYHTLGLVDSKLFPLKPQVEEVQKIADLLHLEHRVLPGTENLLQKLLCGPYIDGTLLRIGPYQEVTKSLFDNEIT